MVALFVFDAEYAEQVRPALRDGMMDELRVFQLGWKLRVLKLMEEQKEL